MINPYPCHATRIYQIITFFIPFLEKTFLFLSKNRAMSKMIILRLVLDTGSRSFILWVGLRGGVFMILGVCRSNWFHICCLGGTTGVGRAKAFEGTTIRRSSTALGLNGYKPHFLNPLMMFSNVNDKAQTSEAKSSVVI